MRKHLNREDGLGLFLAQSTMQEFYNPTLLRYPERAPCFPRRSLVPPSRHARTAFASGTCHPHPLVCRVREGCLWHSEADGERLQQ